MQINSVITEKYIKIIRFTTNQLNLTCLIPSPYSTAYYQKQDPRPKIHSLYAQGSRSYYHFIGCTGGFLGMNATSHLHSSLILQLRQTTAVRTEKCQTLFPCMLKTLQEKKRIKKYAISASEASYILKEQSSTYTKVYLCKAASHTEKAAQHSCTRLQAPSITGSFSTVSSKVFGQINKVKLYQIFFCGKNTSITTNYLIQPLAKLLHSCSEHFHIQIPDV